jgi:hypothetical protein
MATPPSTPPRTPLNVLVTPSTADTVLATPFTIPLKPHGDGYIGRGEAVPTKRVKTHHVVYTPEGYTIRTDKKGNILYVKNLDGTKRPATTSDIGKPHFNADGTEVIGTQLYGGKRSRKFKKKSRRNRKYRKKSMRSRK